MSMSAAATLRTSPRRNTAQSSPIATTISGGGDGSFSERLRMTSNSFKLILYRFLNAIVPSTPHLPYGFPQNVRFFVGVPGVQAVPLLLGRPDVGVVRVAFGVMRRTPGLDPGPPDDLRLGIETSLFKSLALGASSKVLTGLEHTARVLPEPRRRLEASQKQCPGFVAPQVHHDSPSTEVGADDAGARRIRRRRSGERSTGESPHGACNLQNVLLAPPARESEPFIEGGPPVLEVLVGEPNLVGADPAHVRNAREKAAAGALPDPGGEQALRGDEEAGLLVDLTDSASLEALTGGEASRGRLPSTGRALEQEHPTVRADR